MICAKCGADNPSDSAYCGGCGSFLTPAPLEATSSATPPQQPLVPSSSEPTVPRASEGMPAFHALTPVPQTPSPAPSVSEVVNINQDAPQGGSGESFSAPSPYQDQASSSAPDFSVSAYPTQAVPEHPSGP